MRASSRERQALAATDAVDHDAVADVQIVRRRLQDAPAAGEHVGAQRLAGLPGGFAADPAAREAQVPPP